MNDLLPVAFAVALLGMMETTSVAKSIAANSGQRLSINQEIFGLAIGNLVSAFIGAAHFRKSCENSTNFHYGAQTRFSAILMRYFWNISLYLLEPNCPYSACGVGGSVALSAANIVNPKHFFLCLKATSADAFVLWMTLFSCIFFSLDIAFYIGVVFSIILYLKKAAMPQLVEYDIDVKGRIGQYDLLPCARAQIHTSHQSGRGTVLWGRRPFSNDLKRLPKTTQAQR